MSKIKINRIIQNEYNSKILKIKEYLCSNFNPGKRVTFIDLLNYSDLLKIFSNEDEEKHIKKY